MHTVRWKKRVAAALSALLILLFFPAARPRAAALKAGDTILFGSYPQTRVTDETLLPLLEAAEKTWKSYGYMRGSGNGNDGRMTPGDYMRFADFFVNGVKYRAVEIREYRPYTTAFEANHLPALQQTNGYACGETAYFRYEPLSWRVLDPDEGLVLCEKAVDAQPFQNTVFADGGFSWQTAAELNYANDYAAASLRRWLNEQFLLTAFHRGQRGNIRVSDVPCDCPDDPVYAVRSVRDPVFLLSGAEVADAAYGFAGDPVARDASRGAKATEYARSQGAQVNGSAAYGGNLGWWLRSSVRDTLLAEAVNSEGAVIYTGSAVHITYLGVRPAMRLASLESDPSVASYLYSAGVNGSGGTDVSTPMRPGDVNGDGSVTAEDARLCLRRAVGLESFPAGGPQFTACDMSGDGEVTAADARLVLRVAVGLPVEDEPMPPAMTLPLTVYESRRGDIVLTEYYTAYGEADGAPVQVCVFSVENTTDTLYYLSGDAITVNGLQIPTREDFGNALPAKGQGTLRIEIPGDYFDVAKNGRAVIDELLLRILFYDTTDGKIHPAKIAVYPTGKTPGAFAYSRADAVEYKTTHEDENLIFGFRTASYGNRTAGGNSYLNFVDARFYLKNKTDRPLEVIFYNIRIDDTLDFPNGRECYVFPGTAAQPEIYIDPNFLYAKQHAGLAKLSYSISVYDPEAKTVLFSGDYKVTWKQ